MRLKETAELRTILLLGGCYVAIILLILNPLSFPLWIQACLLIPFITLHSSLQHECIHGHPLTNQRINDAIAMLPVGIFLSYFRFKESHLKHHNNHIICDPHDDPETWYLSLQAWKKLSKIHQTILQMNNTLLGRMVIGPIIGSLSFLTTDILKGGALVRATWAFHFLMSASVLYAIHLWGNIPLWTYLCCCYLGLSLLMVRTFLEHQAEKSILARTVIIEKKGFFSFLFLNNNFHAVHHAYPTVAWYRVPALFERNRDRFLGKNKGYYFESYWQVFLQYFFKAKEPVVYPLHPDNNQ